MINNAKIYEIVGKEFHVLYIPRRSRGKNDK